ncbi:MAG: Fis family transcriptional regulator [Nitrospira bacterium SG8_35_4]|nr:MAG: Fis family transcriptional regulator [Nitrospira bacterium SG8_35_4]
MLHKQPEVISKILVVDDEESIRFTFESFLKDEGYDVVTAKDYHEAVQKISETGFDLIFADIILGGKTGIDLLRKLKKENYTCPVVMITGYPNIDTATDAVRLGAFDYISKPVRPDTLLHTTTMALQHKALYDENEQIRSNLEAIFRSVKDAIITVDKDLTLLEVNRAAQDICGISRKNIGMPFKAFRTHCKGKCLDLLEKTIRSKQSVELYRTECKIDNDPPQVVTITATPLLDRSGLFSGSVLVIRDETRLNTLERNLKERHDFRNIIGQNRKMQDIYSLIEDLSHVQTTVLITGESGTGKELVADAIHYSGDRSSNPIVKVNCSALSENLLESELFGHVKGAFTSADRDKIGRFQKADGGTIFLDEIGEISQRMQLRLLRVLQDKVIERVGDSTPFKVDVRVIAATNQDLSRRVKEGDFREDLYYRLKVVEVALPPLRERKDDIPLMIDHFLQKLNHKFNKQIEAVSEEVLNTFMNYDWPGNVRELEHALEHAFIICRQDTITADHLPKNANLFSSDTPSSLNEKDSESAIIIQALKRSGWNKSKAARLLGVNVRTIYRKMEKYNITPEVM